MFNPPITGNAELDAFLAQQALGTGTAASSGFTINSNTGFITDSMGNTVGYLYKYIAIKYADDNVGTNLSNSPTNKAYYGIKNSDLTTESTTPADYTWYKVTGGFSTTKFLWYQASGGRTINFSVATTSPGSSWLQDNGSSIDADIVTNSTANTTAAAALATATVAQTTANAAQTTANATAADLPNKLTKNAADILSGPITFSTFGGVATTGITIDGAGNATGTGVAMTSKGLIGRNSSGYTFTIDATTGNATFSGSLSAATGTFAGSLSGATGTFSGALSAATGTFGLIQSASSGNRVALNESSTSYLNVYNSSNTSIFSVTGDAGAYSKVTITGASALAALSVTNASGYSGSAVSGTSNGGGHGVIGVTYDTGGSRNGVLGVSSGSGINAAGVLGSNSGSYGVYSFGQFGVSNSTLVTNLNANYLNGYTSSSFLLATGTAADSNALGTYSASSWARIFPTNSGTANAGGSGLNLLGSGSTGIAGAYIGTSGSGNTVTFGVQTTSPSDVRLKEEIEDIDLGLSFVKQLRPVSYKLKADPRHQKGYGFIADEVQQLGVYGTSLVYEEPDWKVGDVTGFKTVHYPSYVAVLVKAVQELSAKVESLEAKLNK